MKNNKYKVNDCDFFLNIKDRLLLCENQIDPYYHIVGKNKKLPNYLRYTKHLPILSFCTANMYLDIPFITPDDMFRVLKVYVKPQCSNWYSKQVPNIKWDKKKPAAVFRGSSTGCGTTHINNIRIKLAYLAQKWRQNPKYNGKRSIDSYYYLNAGITEYKITPKKYFSESFWNLNRYFALSVEIISDFCQILSPSVSIVIRKYGS